MATTPASASPTANTSYIHATITTTTFPKHTRRLREGHTARRGCAPCTCRDPNEQFAAAAADDVCARIALGPNCAKNTCPFQPFRIALH